MKRSTKHSRILSSETIDGVTTARTKPTECPSCHDMLDAVSGRGLPRSGDFTYCLHCRVLLTFTDDMQLRKVTNKEWLALPLEQRLYLSLMGEKIPRWPGGTT